MGRRFAAMCRMLSRITAQAIGEAMRSKGSAVLEDYVDFFDYEGNRYGSTKDAKNAASSYTKALGELLLGDKNAAHVDFSRCLDLKPDHLWAKKADRLDLSED